MKPQQKPRMRPKVPEMRLATQAKPELAYVPGWKYFLQINTLPSYRFVRLSELARVTNAQTGVLGCKKGFCRRSTKILTWRLLEIRYWPGEREI